MCFGGASSAETSINQQQQQMMTTLQNNYNQQFAGQNAILNNLNTSASAIFNQGIGQQGFTAPELAAMRTQSSEGTAQAYQQAKQALGENLSAIGGGNTFLPSGTEAGIENANNLKFAQQNANQQLGITEADYAQGRQNYLNAAGILSGVARQLNPLGYAGAANSAGNSAFGGANTINQQNNAASQALGGLLGGAVGGALDVGGAAIGVPGLGSILGA